MLKFNLYKKNIALETIYQTPINRSPSRGVLPSKLAASFPAKNRRENGRKQNPQEYVHRGDTCTSLHEKLLHDQEEISRSYSVRKRTKEKTLAVVRLSL